MFNLVVPLPHEGTETRDEDTAGSRRAGSGAVAEVIGCGLRRGGECRSPHHRHGAVRAVHHVPGDGAQQQRGQDEGRG